MAVVAEEVMHALAVHRVAMCNCAVKVGSGLPPLQFQLPDLCRPTDTASSEGINK